MGGAEIEIVEAVGFVVSVSIAGIGALAAYCLLDDRREARAVLLARLAALAAASRRRPNPEPALRRGRDQPSRRS